MQSSYYISWTTSYGEVREDDDSVIRPVRSFRKLSPVCALQSKETRKCNYAVGEMSKCFSTCLRVEDEEVAWYSVSMIRPARLPGFLTGQRPPLTAPRVGCSKH